MKKLVLGSMALAAMIAGPAMAADMPVKAPVYKAPPPVVLAYNWTGFYVGANVGYSWGTASNDWNFFAPNGLTGATICSTPNLGGAFCASGSDSNKLNGAIGGFQAGYNWQSGNFVAGVEVDIQLSGQKGDQFFSTINPATLPPTGFLGTVTAAYTEKLQWLGTARGRLGFTPAERVIVYATGGLAYGEVATDGSATATSTLLFNGVSPLGNWSNRATKAGWTVGAGVEGAVSRNWSLKVEYLYVDLGTVRTTFATLPGCPGGLSGCISAAAGIGSINSRVTDNILRVGLNYKFDSTVVAKY
jgi:outer membrane immunogenic protein